MLTLNFGGVGRVYRDYLLDLKDFFEPAPTGFILIIGLATGEILPPPLARIWSLSGNFVIKLKIVKKYESLIISRLTKNQYCPPL